MPLVQVDLGVQAVADKKLDLTAKIAGDLALAKIDLFTNNIIPTPQNVIGDFTLPTFTGYSQKAVTTWGNVDEFPDGSVGTIAQNVVEWIGPGDGSGQTIYGYVLRAAAGGALIRAAVFAAPFGLNTPTDVLDLVAAFVTR